MNKGNGLIQSHSLFIYTLEIFHLNFIIKIILLYLRMWIGGEDRQVFVNVINAENEKLYIKFFFSKTVLSFPSQSVSPVFPALSIDFFR